MRYIYVLSLLILCSCNTRRDLQLPEIENAKITEVLDVSPAYVFYDKTQPDSTLFNRKNLIGTTNWLVNVDKRLTIKQVLPHLQYLENKRRKASMHKNDDAKNYFTCNDTSIQNLGFLEFTNTNFNTNDITSISDTKDILFATFNDSDSFSTSINNSGFKFSKANFEAFLNKLNESYDEPSKVILQINASLTFQDYITIKNKLRLFENRISNNEFFYLP